MSETERADKTEPATPARLQRMADEGEIPLGRDATGAAAMLAGGLALFAVATPLLGALRDLVVSSSRLTVSRADVVSSCTRAFALCLVVCGAAAAGAVAVGALETRGRVWTARLAPDATRLFQKERLTRAFRSEFVVDLLLAAVKIAIVGGILWAAGGERLLSSSRLFLVDPALAPARFAGDAAVAFGAAVLALVALAGGDYGLAYVRFQAKARMTKEEVKREVKEEDGSPELRAQRKRRHRQAAMGHIEREVPRADTIVVNPTHIAVALRYRREEGAAPRVVCKGKGYRAERMREVARRSGVPVVRDVPLARLLYRRVKVGRQVPEESYRAVAAVLAFVYRATGRRAS